jgi:uncharacterized protein (TIGR02246 family)
MRTRNIWLLIGLLCFAVQGGYATAQGTPAAGAAPKPAPAPAAAPRAAAAPAPAAAPKATEAVNAARAADEQAIRAASEALAVAFEKGDSNAISQFFTPDGEYADDDHIALRGREAIGEAYKTFFAARKQVQAKNRVDSIRFLGKDTAIEEGQFTVSTGVGPANVSGYSTLHVRQDGKWLIAMLKEWSEESAHETKLSDLAWLIGSWEAVSSKGIAKTQYEWAPNKSFIKGHYEIVEPNSKEVQSSGTIVLGVDPAVGFIHEWLFSSEGDISESNWAWEEDRWMINTDGTLVDGRATQAISHLQPEGNDAFTWRTVMSAIDGQDQPTTHAVKVTRVKQAAATK